ncbi:permease [Alkalicoccobacillus murimartini]|uniref:Permease n=1 Tax=Alkalicoccobacillus murimartini TaxID=171685 RepID=A0ABT9YLU6_9BACI|nr:permease [Alkalicoccobacillus murimartini]MDQ0208852.1 hypothetical protein [Alkalicoccobacillus murimartini]
MSHKAYRVFFSVASVFLLLFGISLLILSINVGGQVQGHEFMWIAIGIVSAVQGYLVPEFEVNDERMKLIKQKAMFCSYFFIISYSIIFMILLITDTIFLTAIQLLGIFTSLIISTVFLLLVFFSKRY